MTPPRRRRLIPSTSNATGTLGQSIRSHVTVLADPVPRTRSMARSATPGTATTTKKIQVFDENANANSSVTAPASKKSAVKGTVTRSLRSRGPLKENTMNVLEERKMDTNGKRKAVDDHEKDEGAKMIKLGHQQQYPQSTKLPNKTRDLKSIRTASRQSSNESLRSLKPSLPTTPTHRPPTAFAAPQPTPARELLRKHEYTDPSVTSPPAHLVARPPTPPRMRERPTQIPASDPYLPPTTPERAHSTIEQGMKTGAKLSKMPASLRKTPGKIMSTAPTESSLPSTTPMHAPMSRSIGSPPKQPTSSLSLATPSVAPSPRKVFSSMSRPGVSTSTTPRGPPPSLFDRLSSVGGPSVRATPAPSPLTSRIAAASKERREMQSSLKDFFQKAPTSSTPVRWDAPELKEGAASGIKSHIKKVTRSQATDCEDVVMKEPETSGVTDIIFDEASPFAAASSINVVPAETVSSKSNGAGGPVVDEAVVSKLAPLALPNITSTREPNVMAPSRIPRSSALPTLSSTAKATEKHSSSAVTKKPSIGSGLGSLPERRPSSRPALVVSSTASTSSGNAVPAAQAASTMAAPPSPVKRKPSYPSSLGSGPLARPTPRMVSNPILPPRCISDSSTSSAPDDRFVTPQSRSVSAPAPAPTHAPKPRLSGGSTREGLSGETSKSLVGLSEALGKLKQKRVDVSSSTSTTSSILKDSNIPSINIMVPNQIDEKPSNLSSSLGTAGTTSRIAATGHRSRASVHPGDLSTSSDEGTGADDQSIAALLCSTNGGGCLRGVRAFVDVRTADGEDSGKLFVEILRGLGAKVFSRPTERCTHIIYKSGKPSTLSWWRKQEDSKPFIVGIKWVMDSKKGGKRAEEGSYIVNVEEEDIFQKRRKSMEPKSLAASQGLSVPVNPIRQAMLDVAQARKQSMKYAPKISSPLKRGFMQLDDE